MQAFAPSHTPVHGLVIQEGVIHVVADFLIHDDVLATGTLYS